jgi:hypothetical protein
MKHEDLQELLVMKHYSELTPVEAGTLEEHLASCADCRQEEVEIERAAQLLSSSMPGARDELIAAARGRLMDSLPAPDSADRAGATRRLGDWLAGLTAPVRSLAWAGSALSLLAAGFFLGYLVFGTSDLSRSDSLEVFRNPEIRVTGVAFEQTDPDSNQVALSFDATRKVRLEGSLDDAQIQRVLAHALIAEENPGVRLQAVSVLRQKSPAEQEAITALIGALRTDPNPAVRQLALAALRGYPSTEEIRAALVDVLLNDRNARIRIEAIEGLSAAADSGLRIKDTALERLGRQLNQDENSYVRRKGKAFLEQAGYRLN